MTFTQALLIISAVAVGALALTCYHLLRRVDLLEQAVSGGIEPPSSRLSREAFEQRFARAVQRAELAATVGHGLVLVVGAEFPDGELEATLANLDRGDALHLLPVGAAAGEAVDRLEVAAMSRLSTDAAALGAVVTPYLFIVDQARITRARPLSSPAELVELLRTAT